MGCDLIVGLPCNESAWSAEIGLAIHLAPRRMLQPYAAARIGRLVPGSNEAAVWNPSVSFGVLLKQTTAVAVFSEVRYSGLVPPGKNDRNDIAYADGTDRVFVQIGLRVGL